MSALNLVVGISLIVSRIRGNLVETQAVHCPVASLRLQLLIGLLCSGIPLLK